MNSLIQLNIYVIQIAKLIFFKNVSFNEKYFLKLFTKNIRENKNEHKIYDIIFNKNDFSNHHNCKVYTLTCYCLSIITTTNKYILKILINLMFLFASFTSMKIKF